MSVPPDTESNIRRGKRAELLLADPLLVECFDRLQQETLKAWQSTNLADTNAREKYWLTYNVVSNVKEQLTIIANGGKIAQRDLDDARNSAEEKGQ